MERRAQLTTVLLTGPQSGQRAINLKTLEGLGLESRERCWWGPACRAKLQIENGLLANYQRGTQFGAAEFRLSGKNEPASQLPVTTTDCLIGKGVCNFKRLWKWAVLSAALCESYTAEFWLRICKCLPNQNVSQMHHLMADVGSPGRGNVLESNHLTTSDD